MQWYVVFLNNDNSMLLELYAAECNMLLSELLNVSEAISSGEWIFFKVDY